MLMEVMYSPNTKHQQVIYSKNPNLIKKENVKAIQHIHTIQKEMYIQTLITKMVNHTDIHIMNMINLEETFLFLKLIQAALLQKM